MDKILLIDKPAGMTSFDVVRQCRRVFHEKKIGHTGTLDPEASGLMLVLTGRYTKLLPFCVKNHKEYYAEFLLGIRTETEDIWGSVVEERDWKEHSREELTQAQQRLTGQISQVPPMYSALKVNGKKLYEYARQGIVVERKPREVTVSSLCVSHIEKNRYSMEAVVSSGTYIRTLITDFCQEIGEIGSMSLLRRQKIEHLSLADAVSLSDLTEEETGLNPAEVIDPEWQLIEAEDEKPIRNGRAVRMQGAKEKIMFMSSGSLLAAYELRDDGMYHCVRGLG